MTIAKFQSEAIKAKDQDKIKALVQERERIGSKVEFIYKDRTRAEEEMLAQEGEKLNIKELVEGRKELAKIAREIIEIDKINEQEMEKRMGAIEENLLAIDKAKSLKETYLEGTRGGRRESIFINKHQ